MPADSLIVPQSLFVQLGFQVTFSLNWLVNIVFDSIWLGLFEVVGSRKVNTVDAYSLILTSCAKMTAAIWDCRSLTTSERIKKSVTLCLEGQQQEWRQLSEHQLEACSSVLRREPLSGIRVLRGELYV